MLKLMGGAFNNRASDTEILIKGHYFKALDISCILQSLDKCADLEFDDPSERMDGCYAKTVYDQIDGYFSSATDVTKKSWESFSGSSMPSLSRNERWSKENFYTYILPIIKLGSKPSKDPSFNAWIHKNVASLRSVNGFVGSCLFGLEQSFVTTHIDFSEIVIVTACVEIAVVVDVTQSVRDAADIIKREGPVVILLAEILQSVDAYYTSACESMSFPNVHKYVDYAISQRFSPPDHILPQFDKPDGGAVIKELEKAWKEYYLELTVSFMNNFDTTIMDNSCFPHWRAASMADPLNMQRGKVTLGDLRNRLEPLKDNMVSDELIRRMEDELPAYAQACSSLEWSNYTHVERLDKIEEFWCKHTSHLPSWSEFVSLVLLLQPTVRCVDKFHAKLDEVIKEEETKPAEYHLEAAVTLRYNRGSPINAAY